MQLLKFNDNQTQYFKSLEHAEHVTFRELHKDHSLFSLWCALLEIYSSGWVQKKMQKPDPISDKKIYELLMRYRESTKKLVWYKVMRFYTCSSKIPPYVITWQRPENISWTCIIQHIAVQYSISLWTLTLIYSPSHY
jgi:hypothetical protein